jgi:hypothetical protein
VGNARQAHADAIATANAKRGCSPLCLGRHSPIFLQFFYLFSIFFLNRF